MSAQDHSERVHREDMVMFVNACFACSGQQEFYSDRSGQWFSIEFLHAYIHGGYRRLYARCLAAGINHFNQTRIIFHLLSQPAGRLPEEGELIRAALRELPVPRVLRLFDELRVRRVNNRRTRAVIKEYILGRDDPTFDAVKYRARLRRIARHAHVKWPGETGDFLFLGRRKKAYTTPLFENYRRALYDREAIYALPYTIAEGFAETKGIPRAEFLEKIEPRMSAAEKLRLQKASVEAKVDLRFDLARASLTRLALFVLSLNDRELAARQDELEAALTASARRALRKAPLRLGKAAAVLDRSYSTSGSREKRRRPLAVAFAAHYLLREASSDYRAFWMGRGESGFVPRARGQTDLGTPLLDALEWRPEVVLIVSDGFENDPPGAAEEVARVYERLPGSPGTKAALVHFNPVYDEWNYNPRILGPTIPTVGLRDAEDLPTMLGFARFAAGRASLEELEAYLSARTRDLLERHERRS